MRPDTGTALSDLDIRLARNRAEMDQARAEQGRAGAEIRRLTDELIEIGAEARAEMDERENANA